MKKPLLMLFLAAVGSFAWLGNESEPEAVSLRADPVERSAEAFSDQETTHPTGASAQNQSAHLAKPNIKGGFYASILPQYLQQAWNEFSQEFPEVDATDRSKFHQAIMQRRARYGFELTAENAAEFEHWLETAGELSTYLIQSRARAEGLELGGTTASGVGFALVGYEQGKPIYTHTTNVSAAITNAASFVRQNANFDPILGPSITGAGLYININDHGEIYQHNEFTLPGGGSRIVLAEIPSYSNGNRSHTTHVTGTAAAWGYNSTLKGMAPAAWIRAHIQQFPWDITGFGMQYPGQTMNNNNPITGEKEMRSVVGNTSLGIATGNQGAYTSTARIYDQLFWDYPYYLHVQAASNEGSNFASLGQDLPTAKNLLTIGSVNDATRNAAAELTSAVNIASISSRGPTFDGRIKPDLTANGTTVTSTDFTTGSSIKSGTSMAAPGASGAALLLIDYFRQNFPAHFLRAATLKALLINSADDAGEPGPDYTYGWGLVNTRAAAEMIKRLANDPSSRVIVEDTLANGTIWSASYAYDGSGPIRVTLGWHDLPGDSQVGSDRSPRLINDLNLRLIAPDGVTVHSPFVMPFVTGNEFLTAFDSNLRSFPATTGTNTTDNVEQVYIATPVAGSYIVEVSHSGTVIGGAQRFSLVIAGAERTDPLNPIITSISPAIGSGADFFALTVNGEGFVLGTNILLRRHGSPDISCYAHVITGSRITCRVDTAGLAKGYWDVVARAPDGTESVLPAAFLLPGGAFDTWMTGFDGINPEAAGPFGNPTQDGVVNLLKFAFGIDPTANTGSGLPTTWIEPTGQGHRLYLTYHRRRGGIATDPASYQAEGLFYSVQLSPDLSNWSTHDTLGETWVEYVDDPPGTPVSESIETITLRTRSDLNEQEPTFLRLKVDN